MVGEGTDFLPPDKMDATRRASRGGAPAGSPRHVGGRALLGALKVVAGVALLWMALRGVDLPVILEAVGRMDARWLAVVAATVFLGLAFKALRWWLLLRPILPGVSRRETFGALMTGQAFNLLGVFRAGDMVRAVWMASSAPIQLPAVLTGIVVEKAIDMIMLALALLIMVPVLPLDVPLASQGPLLLALGGGALLAALLAIRFAPEAWGRLRGYLASRPGVMASRSVSLGDRLVAGFRQLRGLRGKGYLALMTFLAWAAMLSTNMALARGLGIQIPLAAGLLVLVLVLLGVMPGLMPGQVGPIYFFARLGLEQFGVRPAEGVAYAALLHAAIVLPPTVGAAIYLLAGRWRVVRGLRRHPE